MPSPVCLAVGAQGRLPAESRPSRSHGSTPPYPPQPRRRPAESEFAQAPGRPEAGPARRPASSRLREHGDGEPCSLLVLVELEVEEPEWPVVGRICDHERRPCARAPLLLGPRDTLALSIRRERLVVQSAPGLGVVRHLRDDRHVFLSPHSQDDFTVAERPVGRNEAISCRASGLPGAADARGAGGPLRRARTRWPAASRWRRRS